MSTTTTVRVYYDEDEERDTKEEITAELKAELNQLDAVLDIQDILKVATEPPHEATVVLSIDNSGPITAESVAYGISVNFPFVHNCDVTT